MISRTNRKRRQFLRSLAYMTILSFVQPIRVLNKLCRYDEVEHLTSKMIKFYHDTHSAQMIGREYLKYFSEEADINLLVDLLCSHSLRKRRALVQADMSKLREMMLQMQRDDFEHSHVVNIRGWILSQTECRLCAMAALV